MGKNNGTKTAVAREMIEGKIGLEAFERAGRNPQLKGVVHETAYKTMYNLDPKHMLNGTKATLSKSTTALRDDILIKKGTSVVGRMQLKDTTNSIGKTIKQVQAGKYARTNLTGTFETVEKFTKAASKAGNVTQKMSSTGISSLDTARIATKTIGANAGKLTASQLGRVASSSGPVGAVISGGIETISSGVKLAKGEIKGGEFMKNVTKETVGGGISAAGGSVAASAVGAGTATLIAGTALASAPIIPVVAAGAAAIAVGSAIKGIWDSLFD